MQVEGSETEGDIVTFRDTLRVEIERQHKTAYRFCKAKGFKTRFIYAVLSGKFLPGDALVREYARALGLDEEALSIAAGLEAPEGSDRRRAAQLGRKLRALTPGRERA